SDFGNKVLNDGNWHLIVGVYPCPAGADQNTQINGSIYVDGVLDVTSNGSLQDLPFYGIGQPGASQPLYIGTDDDGQTSAFNGMFCDLPFYSVALTASQIAAMYDPATRWQLYSSGAAPAAASLATPGAGRTTNSVNRPATSSTGLADSNLVTALTGSSLAG